MKKTIIILAVAAVFILGALIYVITQARVEKFDSVRIGMASWYGKGVCKDGTGFDGKLLSCASAFFPRYSLLLVENLATSKKVLVWNNDIHDATDIIIDLSKKAFTKIELLRHGKIVVEVTYLGILQNPNADIFGKRLRWKTEASREN